MYKVFKPGGVYIGYAATYAEAKQMVAPHIRGYVMESGTVVYINKEANHA